MSGPLAFKQGSAAKSVSPCPCSRRYRDAVDTFTGSYAKTPFWIGEEPDFDGPGGRDKINPVTSTVVYHSAHGGTFVRMYRDGCIEVRVPELEQILTAANKSFDDSARASAGYAKHLNVLFLCLEIVCLKVQNAAVLSHSELTIPDLFRANYRPGSTDASGNICFDSHVGAYQQGRMQGHYKQELPPSFDMRIFLRRNRVVDPRCCEAAFLCYCAIRKDPALFQDVSSLSKAVGEYKGGNFSTSTVLCWFILERCLNERFAAYLETKMETLDQKPRITSERRKFLTGSAFSAAVVSNVLELADLLTHEQFLRINEIRKMRNDIAHSLKDDVVTVDRCRKNIEFTADFLLGGVIEGPRLNLGLMTMGS
ncbi:hypothetical protein [Oleiharenicola lentus]|uniref:hypothetical protein n=1 Tax=Oleiharenicola lentus TaxID=2508720 RepID=UPI003F67D8C6